MDLTKREKIGLSVFALILLFIVSYVFLSNRKNDSIEVISKNKNSKSTITSNDKNSEIPKKIKAYICGEVVKPGVYSLTEGDRVISLIEMAGGFTDKADQASVNLALKIKDEDFIKIPSFNTAAAQNGSSGAIVVANTPNSNSKININSASKEQLESLPRIGPALAQRIIDYRTNNGPFKKCEDLMNVSGIGQKTFDGFKDKISAN